MTGAHCQKLSILSIIIKAAENKPITLETCYSSHIFGINLMSALIRFFLLVKAIETVQISNSNSKFRLDAVHLSAILTI